MALKILGVILAGGAGGTVGWFVGMVVCPNPGDIGIEALPWAVGGLVVGTAVGVAVGVAVVT